MLKGKTALVTGSTSGIGLAVARALAAEGANVTINGFGDKAAIEKERTAIEKEFGVKALYSPADMSKPAEIAAMVRTTEQAFGSLDVLVNNAGIQYVAPIEEFPIEKWDQIIAINLSSAFHTIRAALPGMKARKWGRIINTASAHSLVASPFKVAYVSAKHGLAGLTKTVALEVATFGITGELHQPRLCVDAAGREADSRHDEGARADRGTGQARRAARGAADQGIRHRRRESPRSRSIFAPTRRSRSPAPISRSTAAGRRHDASFGAGDAGIHNHHGLIPCCESKASLVVVMVSAYARRVPRNDRR